MENGGYGNVRYCVVCVTLLTSKSRVERDNVWVRRGPETLNRVRKGRDPKE